MVQRSSPRAHRGILLLARYARAPAFPRDNDAARLCGLAFARQEPGSLPPLTGVLGEQADTWPWRLAAPQGYRRASRVRIFGLSQLQLEPPPLQRNRAR